MVKQARIFASAWLNYLLEFDLLTLSSAINISYADNESLHMQRDHDKCSRWDDLKCKQSK